MRLQLLEARGELAAAPADKRAGALPAFKDWRFSRAAYLQYVADCAAVHGALEEAAAAAAGAHAPLLAWLAPAGGLARGAQARADAAALCAAAPAAAAAAAAPAAPPPPSAAAAAHAARLAALAAAARAGDAAAAARLAAHGYALHVSHVSLGMRLGAKAAEQLGLAQLGALALYAQYPALPAPSAGAAKGTAASPLAALARAVDALGAALPAAPREALLEELPEAVRAASRLWARLAVAGSGEGA